MLCVYRNAGPKSLQCCWMHYLLHSGHWSSLMLPSSHAPYVFPIGISIMMLTPKHGYILSSLCVFGHFQSTYLASAYEGAPNAITGICPEFRLFMARSTLSTPLHWCTGMMFIKQWQDLSLGDYLWPVDDNYAWYADHTTVCPFSKTSFPVSWLACCRTFCLFWLHSNGFLRISSLQHRLCWVQQLGQWCSYQLQATGGSLLQLSEALGVPVVFLYFPPWEIVKGWFLCHGQTCWGVAWRVVIDVIKGSNCEEILAQMGTAHNSFLFQWWEIFPKHLPGANIPWISYLVHWSKCCLS